MVTAAEAEVRVVVEDKNGVAWIHYECTAGEVIRSFALDVSVDRGQISNVTDFFVGTCSVASKGYGIFPAAFRDHVAATVTSGTSATWSVSGYDPVASVTDAPGGTLAGLGTSGVTLELGALWDPALPEAAPASSGTLCALHLSQGAHVSVAANASRGGVVASPDGNVVVPTFAGADVGPLPEIAIEQPDGSSLNDGGSKNFGSVVLDSSRSLIFTIKNTGTADLTGLAVSTDGANPDDFTVTPNPILPVSGPDGTRTFTVQFRPTVLESRSAVIHIANNDSDENPFDIRLSGTGITALNGWTTEAGVPPDQAGPQQAPQGDGVVNLLKFAFNMDPTKPDRRTLSVGAKGTVGLPGGDMVDGVLCIEFLRRKAGTHPGITYIPQFSSDLDFRDDFTGAESVSQLSPESSTWERVRVADPAPGPGQRFGRLKVVQTQ
jgi:hypothetical protein